MSRHRIQEQAASQDGAIELLQQQFGADEYNTTTQALEQAYDQALAAPHEAGTPLRTSDMIPIAGAGIHGHFIGDWRMHSSRSDLDSYFSRSPGSWSDTWRVIDSLSGREGVDAAQLEVDDSLAGFYHNSLAEGQGVRVIRREPGTNGDRTFTEHHQLIRNAEGTPLPILAVTGVEQTVYRAERAGGVVYERFFLVPGAETPSLIDRSAAITAQITRQTQEAVTTNLAILGDPRHRLTASQQAVHAALRGPRTYRYDQMSWSEHGRQQEQRLVGGFENTPDLNLNEFTLPVDSGLVQVTIGSQTFQITRHTDGLRVTNLSHNQIVQQVAEQTLDRSFPTREEQRAVHRQIGELYHNPAAVVGNRRISVTADGPAIPVLPDSDFGHGFHVDLRGSQMTIRPNDAHQQLLVTYFTDRYDFNLNAQEYAIAGEAQAAKKNYVASRRSEGSLGSAEVDAYYGAIAVNSWDTRRASQASSGWGYTGRPPMEFYDQLEAVANERARLAQDERFPLMRKAARYLGKLIDSVI
ncbi:MAG TPA: hypothetical protein VLF91_02390 [Candidatus Saccharimonadales bacterium]|nr:hypothetical protein [Candidatus Saccharimonadales bacterium]